MLSRFSCLLALGASASGVMARGPQLPEVESVLTKATGKMQDFAAEASAMQARVAQKQKASREALAKQKQKYEQELQVQAANNTATEMENADLQKQISGVQSSNNALQAEAERLQKENMMMRTTITSVQEKVQAAKLFLQDSLHLTADTDVEELHVLEPEAPKPTLEHFLEVAKSDSVLSFLQVSKRGSPEAPEDLVQVLSASLGEIASAEKEGEAELKAHFLAAFEAGNEQKEKLFATQKLLKDQLASVQAHEEKLKAAKAKLEGTRQQLQQRLHGLRVFARKVDAAAYSALKTVEPAAATKAAAGPTAAPAELKKTAATDAKRHLNASKPVAALLATSHAVDGHKVTAAAHGAGKQQREKALRSKAAKTAPANGPGSKAGVKAAMKAPAKAPASWFRWR